VAKFTNAQARRIRERYFYDGVTQEKLAKTYKCAVVTISRLVSGKVYTGAGGPTAADGHKRAIRPKKERIEAGVQALARETARAEKRRWNSDKVDLFAPPRIVIPFMLVPTFGERV